MVSRFISADEPIALAMGLIPNSDSFDKAIARQWIYEGLKQIGPSQHWFEEKVLYPNSQKAFRKPDDFYRAIDIALLDASGKELRYSYKGLGKRIHSSGNIVLDSGEYAPGLHAPIDLSEDAYFFHLGSNGSDVAAMKIKYWRLPVDAYGAPLVPEYASYALALFVRYMWTFANADRHERSLALAEWTQARNEAKAKGRMPSGVEFEQIAKEWMNLLNAPQFKRY